MFIIFFSFSVYQKQKKVIQNIFLPDSFLVFFQKVAQQLRHVRLTYKPYFFSQRTVFFSYNKSANSTFNHDLSAKRTGQRSKLGEDTLGLDVHFRNG